MRTLIGIAFLLASTLCLSGSGHAETLQNRVKKLEKKTDYYQTRALSKRKEWGRIRLKPATSAASEDTSAPAIVYASPFIYYIDLGSKPVVSIARLKITGGYAVDASEVALRVTVSPTLRNDVAFRDNNFCDFQRRLPGPSGTIDLDVFCQGIVNAQLGEVLRIHISFSVGTFTTELEGLTLNADVVNQVMDFSSE